MNITFEELRAIKHQLPSGSIKKIAEQMNLDEQSVRNYFGADDYDRGDVPDLHIQPGPKGGIVSLEDTSILELARQMIQSTGKA